MDSLILRRLFGTGIALLLLSVACSPPSDVSEITFDTYGPAPDYPTGPLSAQVVADLDLVFNSLGDVDLEALARLGESEDPRLGWLLADLLRFFQSGAVADAVPLAFASLTDTPAPEQPAWVPITNALIAWDLPAPPDYVRWKRIYFESTEPAWSAFFDDSNADIDWRILSWGGVLIDDRPIDKVDQPCPDGCIPALDDPAVTQAGGGNWYGNEGIVFGVVVGGQARAYPRHMMQVHEMVNDTLGGRRIGVPYCTLCGSAQAYFTDEGPPGLESIELRTSGLLSRSNKVMFDLNSFSVFDTFTGRALSGPLQDADYQLEQIAVVTSTWGDWKRAHPDTTIVAEDGGIGRVYSRDPLGSRDDAGPIFPVGPVDPRLPVQQQILGVITADGQAIAFPADQAREALTRGEVVEFDEVTLRLEGGLVAEERGVRLDSHQAFWFAWSQFHADTLLWMPS